MKRYDARSVAQMLSDDDTPVAAGDLATNETLQALLAEASGEIESAACAGQRYVIDDNRNDLASLTGNSAEHLAGMVAHLTAYLLWCRRPNFVTPGGPPPKAQEAKDFLERLRLGERVYGILEAHRSANLQAQLQTPAEVETRNGVEVQADRFFGTRVDRNQPGRRNPSQL